MLGAIVAAVLCAVSVGACEGGDDAAQSPLTPDDNTSGDNGGDDNTSGDDGDVAGGGNTSGDDSDTDGDDSGDDSGGGGGNGGGGGGVPGAPIDIPNFQIDAGRLLVDVLADIERAVRAQCDGELCIDIKVERSEESLPECRFSKTIPEQGGQVERGSTLIVIAGTQQPCDVVEGNGGEGSGGEGSVGEGSGGEGSGGEGSGGEGSGGEGSGGEGSGGEGSGGEGSGGEGTGTGGEVTP
jgi:hypothetical protein